MSTSETHFDWDSVEFDDPWERLEHAAPCLEWICYREDVQALRRFVLLAQSLEMRIREGEDGRGA